MKTRPIAILILFAVFTTVLWAILFIYAEATAPTVQTLADRIAAIESRFGLFILTYANAGLLTLACVAAMAGLCVYCRDEDPLWSTVALAFVPLYGLGNILVYLSQIFVVPGLLDLYHQPQTADIAETLLGLTIQSWNGSAVAFVNALAYTILGIPSFILGTLLYRKAPGLRVGSLLLAASGLLSVVALVGLGIGSAALGLMSPLSGFVYLLALILLGAYFLRQSRAEAHATAPRTSTEIS